MEYLEVGSHSIVPRSAGHSISLEVRVHSVSLEAGVIAYT